MPRRLVLAIALATSSAVTSIAPARATTVWAIDDGEKIRRDDAASDLSTGVDNPVWAPGQPIRLFALRDEVIAFQVVVRADSEPLDAVDAVVSLPGAPTLAADLFVETFLDIPRPSSTEGSKRSLGWAAGSGPDAKQRTGWVPDPLVPVGLAPAWMPWPMSIARNQNGVVWVDVTVPADAPPGVRRGEVVVRRAGQPLARLPLEVDVLDATMPARPLATMLYYSGSAMAKRIGDAAAAERQLWTLFHAHRLTPLHAVASVNDVNARRAALDGSLYTPGQGYVGPARGLPDDVVVVGMYGDFGDPSAEAVARVEAIADALAAAGVFERASVILYAEDEVCASPRGAGWRDALARSSNPNARRVRVGWTCDDDPTKQPVAVPIVSAAGFDPARAAAARAEGKETWIYNGYRPATGAMHTDTEATSLTTFGWIATMADVRRWFIWNTTAWYDQNAGGHGAFDPFVTAETFHNRGGEAAMGDGVLIYPGRQIDQFSEHSLGFAGVLPSIRLKALRRGVQDAGYYRLARGAARDEADAIARALLPRILAEARFGDPPSWPARGAAFFESRRKLAALIRPGAGADPGPGRTMGSGPRPVKFTIRWRHLALIVVAGAALLLIVGLRLRGRRRGERVSSP